MQKSLQIKVQECTDHRFKSVLKNIFIFSTHNALTIWVCEYNTLYICLNLENTPVMRNITCSTFNHATSSVKVNIQEKTKEWTLQIISHCRVIENFQQLWNLEDGLADRFNKTVLTLLWKTGMELSPKCTWHLLIIWNFAFDYYLRTIIFDSKTL